MSEQALNIEFVQEIEKYPCLYNNRIIEYARRDFTDKAWSKVGAKFNMSGAQCKEKWKNLRTVFSRNLKPSLDAPGKKKKPYYLSEAMKFATPFIKSQHNTAAYKYESVSKSPAEYIEIETLDQEDDEEDSQDPMQEIKLENDLLCVTDSPIHVSSPSYTTPLPSPQINNVQPSSPVYSLQNLPTLIPAKRGTNGIHERDEHFHDYPKPKEARTTNTHSTDHSKISKKRFLLSLLPDVYAMNDEQMRWFRIKVLNLIEECVELR